MNFNWFYRICKKREETTAQHLERLARRERLRDEFIGICLIAAVCLVVVASCKALGY